MLEEMIRRALDENDGEIAQVPLLRYIGPAVRSADIRAVVDSMPDVVSYFGDPQEGGRCPLIHRLLRKSDVLEFIASKGFRYSEDDGVPNSTEVRYYLAEKPREDARQERAAVERKRWEEQSAKAEESRQRAEHYARHMKLCREWGNANGFTVGTRGAIPKAVRKAYKEATGVEL
ncbi:histone-like nucleoid-structuring protein Lsr2 [Kitasatospora sp. NPDC058218]|uniref:Lsr2 family DNA-binding protein n=1 Tax=Kitasatospora sp. NPDC058218 TaxID=3346385 RepID=UPI0036DB4D3F